MNYLTYHSAKAIVLDYLNNVSTPREEMTVDDRIMEVDEGYIFYFNTKRYLEQGMDRYRLSGVCVLIIDKITHEIFHPCQDMLNSELIRAIKKRRLMISRSLYCVLKDGGVEYKL